MGHVAVVSLLAVTVLEELTQDPRLRLVLTTTSTNAGTWHAIRVEPQQLPHFPVVRRHLPVQTAVREKLEGRLDVGVPRDVLDDHTAHDVLHAVEAVHL